MMPTAATLDGVWAVVQWCCFVVVEIGGVTRWWQSTGVAEFTEWVVLHDVDVEIPATHQWVLIGDGGAWLGEVSSCGLIFVVGLLRYVVVVGDDDSVVVWVVVCKWWVKVVLQWLFGRICGGRWWLVEEGWLALALMVVSLTKMMGNFWYFLAWLKFLFWHEDFLYFFHSQCKWMIVCVVLSENWCKKWIYDGVCCIGKELMQE